MIADQSTIHDLTNYREQIEIISRPMVLRPAQPSSPAPVTRGEKNAGAALSNGLSTITIVVVQRPPNLISDSPLVQETFEFVRESGGRAECIEITKSIFHLHNATGQLAASLVADLVQNDPRFYIEDIFLAIKPDGIETQPLPDIEFVVVDVEAIAGKSMPTRVIEIGACRIARGAIVDEFETLVNPELPVPRFISTLTGITEDMLSDAPAFAAITESWLNFAGDAVLAAHNSTFDITLLNQEIARVFPGCRMRNAELCTVQLARRLIPNLEKHHLDALADHFGFQIAERHRAAGDARATARVLLHLLDELEIRGARTLQDARKLRAKHSSPQTELQLAFNS
jgi:DNA polymerase III epsilon subunit family exonuclease